MFFVLSRDLQGKDNSRAFFSEKEAIEFSQSQFGQFLPIYEIKEDMSIEARYFIPSFSSSSNPSIPF